MQWTKEETHLRFEIKGLSSVALATGILLLAACGGGGSSSSTTSPSTTTSTELTGTAAVGAPISGTVVAIDKNGKVSPPAVTTALGSFVVDVNGMVAPFILSIVGSANGKQVTLNSIATATGQTVNITPLTDLIVSSASGQPAGGTLAALCTPVDNVAPTACLSALSAASDPTKLAAAVKAVKAMIAPLNTDNIDPLNGAFVANGTGLDKVLDQILVTPAETQGAQATITLISTNTQLGSATLPAMAGATTTTAATAPTTAELTKASAAASVLPEIRACVAALSAQYATTPFVVPSESALTPFVDASFQIGALQTQAKFLAALTTNMAIQGLQLRVAGLSSVNMEPLNSTELTDFIASTSATRLADFIASRATQGPISFDGAGAPTSAWVKLSISNDTEVNNWKMLKTSDTTGCAGGWKIAGSSHMSAHMNARVTRRVDKAGAASFGRQWAFHVNVQDAIDENANTNQIEVRGPGLTTFGLFMTDGESAANQKLRLLKPTGVNSVFQIADRDPVAGSSSFSSFYGSGDALQSCQDLAAGHSAPTTNLSTQSAPGRFTPCIDETKTNPGKLYFWTLRAGGVETEAFLLQHSAVPFSKAYTIANQDNIFATVTSVTPATLASLKADTLLDDLVTYHYTQGAAYGSKMDNCGLYVWNGNTQILNAEVAATGKETSCTFTTKSLNSVSSNVGNNLFQFSGTVTDAYIGVSTSVLGVQTTSSKPLPQ